MTSDHDQHAIADLLDFWFAEETKARWWQSTSEFDENCRRRFGHLVEQAANDRLDAWQETAEGALALCLLLDQMPRNLFRGTPKAFVTDAKAVAVAAGAVDRGLDQMLTTEHRKFLYMPFMHSESLTVRIPMKAVSEFDRRRTLGPIEGGHQIRRSRTV